MEYIKTNWEDGDTITAEKLNNIESGIGRITAIPTVVITAHQGEETTYTSDKTYQELYNYFKNDRWPNAPVYRGYCIVLKDNGDGFPTYAYFGEVFATSTGLSISGERTYVNSGDKIVYVYWEVGMSSSNVVSFSETTKILE